MTGRSLPDLRPAVAADIPVLARIWHDGWHEAHAHLLPADLTALRTLQNFAERLPAMLSDTWVCGVEGNAAGFCTIRADELYQLFLAPAARGTGVAQLLVRDAEQRLRARKIAQAWLSCAIGNDRAARLYEKCGWHREGTMINLAETSQGAFPIETWRYVRRLIPAG
jgi:GNAT superfamily N-acetyltransferase